MRSTFLVGGLVGLSLVVLAACHMPAAPESGSGGSPTHGGSPSGTPSTGLLAAPVQPVPPQWDRAKVDSALAQLDGIVENAMQHTGIPGVAVGVVYQDKVLYAKGFGVKKAGGTDPVDTDTVFQVASMSKPVASAIVAGVVGRKQATWTEPVRTYNPDFRLNDPYVTRNATLTDLLSHRSGLPDLAGDKLEDLGWNRDQILSRLRLQPLHPFRAVYDYSNFGITEGGVAAAKAAGTTWEDLADKTLFEPAGMSSSSFSHATYESRTNKALISVPVDRSSKEWASKYVRNADAEAPAGGLSSSINDMMKFVRLQLRNGTLDGEKILDPTALQATRVAVSVRSQPTDAAVRSGFYGLGWNVAYDDQGRVRISHSGAFNLGTSTNIALIPGEDIGIVTLTNGQPQGVPEAIDSAFFDAVQNGSPTVDWIRFTGSQFDAMYAALDEQAAQWKTPPAGAKAPRDLADYVGTYANDYYGPLTVRAAGGKLSMSMGPPGKQTTFALQPFDGDVFTYETIGENKVGPSGATFTIKGKRAVSVNLPFYDLTGLGTFTQS